MAAMKTRLDKLAELILLIASESEDDERFGEVKLHKLLYFSDFTAFARWGESITGSSYQKNRFGPTNMPMNSVIERLIESGDASSAVTNYFWREQRRIEAKREPNLDLFSADELSVVQEVLEEFRDFDATGISNHSHEIPGWQVARDREVIPYASVFVHPDPAPERVAQDAIDLAKSGGWLK